MDDQRKARSATRDQASAVFGIPDNAVTGVTGRGRAAGAPLPGTGMP